MQIILNESNYNPVNEFHTWTFVFGFYNSNNESKFVVKSNSPIGFKDIKNKIIEFDEFMEFYKRALANERELVACMLSLRD